MTCLMSVIDEKVPENFGGGMKKKDFNEWKKAMDEEIH